MKEDIIDSKIKSMDKRKILFIIGEHGRGKTELALSFLKSKYGDEYKEHYIDVGVYIKNCITENMLKNYEIYPKIFLRDCEKFFGDIIKNNFNGRGNLIALDHMEFLLSEGFIKWLVMLEDVTLYANTALVIIPSEYRDMIPVNAYQCIEI